MQIPVGGEGSCALVSTLCLLLARQEAMRSGQETGSGLCGEETVEGKTEKWVSSRKLLGHPGKGAGGSGVAVKVASTARVGPLTGRGVREREESGQARGSQNRETGGTE